MGISFLKCPDLLRLLKNSGYNVLYQKKKYCIMIEDIIFWKGE